MCSSVKIVLVWMRKRLCLKRHQKGDENLGRLVRFYLENVRSTLVDVRPIYRCTSDVGKYAKSSKI